VLVAGVFLGCEIAKDLEVIWALVECGVKDGYVDNNMNSFYL